MIINSANMQYLYTTLSTVFNNAFAGTPTWIDQVAMTVPSGTKYQDYKAILDWPQMKEWIGDRQIRSLQAIDWLVANKSYESSVAVAKHDIQDDQYGLYNPMIAMMATRAKKHRDILLATLINANGTCYDGAAFFSTTHSVAGANVANLSSGAGSAWYLLDTSMPVKPFVFQLRQEIELTRMDLPFDENVFMRKEYRYGVDARYNVTYGLWQTAFKSTQTLDTTYYPAARAAMRKFADADGTNLGINPDLLVVPASLEGQARQLLNTEFISGGGNNIWYNSAKLLVMPELG